jgi:stage V sporulation protein G
MEVNTMQITEVRIFLRNEERLKAYAAITFDDAFVVRNLKVVQGQKGIFVAMPSRKTSDGSYKDVAHPVNNEMRDLIEKKVLEAYEAKLKAVVNGTDIKSDSEEI